MNAADGDDDGGARRVRKLTSPVDVGDAQDADNDDADDAEDEGADDDVTCELFELLVTTGARVAVEA